MPFHRAGRPAQRADAASATDAGTTAARAGAAPTGSAPVTVRSALSATASLRLQIGDAVADLIESHAVLPDGTVVLAVDALSRIGGLMVAARGQAGAAQLDVTQLVPVAVRSRVRARVRVRGTVRRFDPASLDSCDDGAVLPLLDLPPVALWAVEPVDVHLTRGMTETPVDVDAYRAACPDPLAAVEAVHLAHLARHHDDVLHRLAALLDPASTAEPARVVPIAMDADGIVLRAEAPHWHTDIRLPFARPVTACPGLADELRTLLTDAARLGSRLWA